MSYWPSDIALKLGTLLTRHRIPQCARSITSQPQAW